MRRYNIDFSMTEVKEEYLPQYLKIDIDDFIQAINTNDTFINEIYCDLYGSINMAQHGQEINVETANYLRKKYLGLGDK